MTIRDEAMDELVAAEATLLNAGLAFARVLKAGGYATFQEAWDANLEGADGFGPRDFAELSLAWDLAG